MCYWVATEICTQPELKNRAKVIENWIKIAKQCFKLCNYNGTMAIVSGLNVVAVSRLKQTWLQVHPKRLKQLSELEHFLSPSSNHKAYRLAIDTLTKSTTKDKNNKAQPIIPILSIFLKDLIFMNDGNLKYFNENDKIINIDKLKLIYCSIMQMITLQKAPYSKELLIESSSLNTIEYCLHLRALKEDILYKYSCLCEIKVGQGDTVRLRDKWIQEIK
jgi:hypothetical protein